MVIKLITCLIIVSFLVVAGCVRPAPASDSTPPDIVVFVSRARGRNYFRSIDGIQKPPDNCIIVREMPTQLILIAGDAGGLQSAGIRGFSGTIVPDSVSVTPPAPEGSFSITREPSGADRLDITLTPPSPTTVRTGVTATLEVNGALPMSILAWARDRAGHYIELPQFDLRGPETGADCRGK
jgi:hypothetical protein